MRLTDEQIMDIKEYLNRSIKITISSLIPQISKHGLDLIDTIEALRHENEQLRAQVATLKNIKEMLHECMAVRMMPDKVERVVNDALAEIDKAIGGGDVDKG